MADQVFQDDQPLAYRLLADWIERTGRGSEIADSNVAICFIAPRTGQLDANGFLPVASRVGTIRIRPAAFQSTPGPPPVMEGDAVTVPSRGKPVGAVVDLLMWHFTEREYYFQVRTPEGRLLKRYYRPADLVE